MAKCYYVVDIIPHECYMGLPSDPEITVVIDKITTKFGFPVKSEKTFDTCNRDLFKCVSECNKYFAEQKIDARHIQWPDFCRYITTYQE